MAFICNGFGNLDGDRWDNTGGDDDCVVMVAMKRGTTRVGTTMGVH